MTKFEFCSIEWVEAAREYLLAHAEGADLTDLNAFNEVFTDAPDHLNPDAGGRIGWYLRVADGRLEVAAGVLPSADLRVTCDYQTVLPAARRLSSDDPLDETSRQALTDAINGEGDPSVMAGLTWMAGLHDAMAIQTR